MVYEECQRIIMTQTVSAISSKTVWGGLIAFLPFVYQQLPDIILNVLPVLQPHTAVIVQAVGGVLAVLGRYNPEIKPISGIILK